MSTADELAQTPSRYVVGIDLGTTNSAVAFVDTAVDDVASGGAGGKQASARVQIMSIPQLVAPSTIEARENLPSFHYERGQAEFAAGAFNLPWNHGDPMHTVGVFARDQGQVVPGRLIASAKSWLCHSGVDRTAELLPWHGAADVQRLSPVAASARYLAHIRDAWNHLHPQHPLEEQDVVLTLPASFDEVARELTVKAAAQAGLPRVILIEEPQAAFYAWIYTSGEDWERLASPGQKILVCDIGGGTSDFTLIRVRQAGGDKIQFHRVAVGEHLILGGDNLDLALAHHLEAKLASGGKLEPRAWSVLVRACRQVKETLLGENPPERLTVSVPGSGSRLIGSALQAEVTRDEVEALLLEGFLPPASLDAKPAARRSGFQEFGLPYAADAAITKYLAAFLSAHRHVAIDEADASADHDPARPDLVLFNGGFFASPALRTRLLEVLASWFNGPGVAAWRPTVLQNDRLDLAVARGAAYYGMVRRGRGVRISAGLARTYYVGAETVGRAPSAVCLAPAGVEEGQTVDLSNREFHLRIREPVEFPLYVSSTRLTDRAGELVAIDPLEMTALPPIRTVLKAGKKTAGADTVAVQLHARLTEIGTLDLWCSEPATQRSWRLQFDVRSTTQTNLAAHQGAAERLGIVDEELLAAARAEILRTFRPASPKAGPGADGLMKRLAEILGASRTDWPPSLLRGLWETTAEVESGRRLSAAHEARWLSLLGFSLRPGYGLAIDDWRVIQTYRLLQAKLSFGNAQNRAERWIAWRRIAGGLPAGQQRALAEPLVAEFRNQLRMIGKGRASDFSTGAHEAAELWRLLGSLELLTPAAKVELGDLILELAKREKSASVQAAAIWAWGRLAARSPMYGPLNTVVPAAVVGKWIERLLNFRTLPESATFAVVQAARLTGDRYRDVSDAARREALNWLTQAAAPEHYVQLVREGGELAEEEQGLVFGESLPQGLRIL